jgi:hypothetical protein
MKKGASLELRNEISKQDEEACTLRPKAVFFVSHSPSLRTVVMEGERLMSWLY